MPNHGTRDRFHLLASAPLALFAAACSGEVINIGENASNLEAHVSSCPPAGPVFATNQAEIDALAGCGLIDGDLFIRPFDHADLRPLSSLREVRGSLEIGSFSGAGVNDDADGAVISAILAALEARWLRSLEGLEGLELAGNLSVSGFSVETLEPLSNLRILTSGGLQLSSCSGIRDLSGLENVLGVQHVEINCDDLESLRGLGLPPQLGTLSVTGPNLDDLGDFAATAVRDVIIADTGLENLDSLAGVVAVSTLSVTNNAQLRDLSALDGLTSAELLDISGNAALERLPEFESLIRGVETLIVADNPRLENIPTFPGVLENFVGLSEFFELSALDLLSFRPDVLEIRNNAALQQVVLSDGWQAAGLVTIEDNTALDEIAFSNVRAMDLLTIADNPSLRSIDVGALSTVDDLRVSNNPALDLAAFDAVRTFSSELSSAPSATP